MNFERSRALLELAAEASKSTELRELLLAHRALERASESALSERNSLRHDQLLVAVIRATEPLTDALVREGFTIAWARERHSAASPSRESRTSPRCPGWPGWNGDAPPSWPARSSTPRIAANTRHAWRSG